MTTELMAGLSVGLSVVPNFLKWQGSYTSILLSEKVIVVNYYNYL